jgi:uncharacterized glyoxalase superfamily protein PhnB
MSTPHLQSVSPVFLCRDLTKALDYYQQVLGFGLVMSQPPAYGIVKRGEIEIHLAGPMLAQDHQVGNGSCYVFVDDVDALHAELTAKGAKGLIAVVNQPYGMRDFCCADPDGNKIGFGCPVKT